MGKRVAVIGGGSRQNAIAWKLSLSENIEKVFLLSDVYFETEGAETVLLDPSDFDEVATFCESENISYLITGGGEQLNSGIVDFLKDRGIRAFGPSKVAAKLEGSKGYAKSFMKKYGVPTPDYFYFEDLEAAKAYVISREQGPLVVKADGLVRGRGVVVCRTKEQALTALDIFSKNGSAHSSVVIEEYIEGPEVSLHILCDGESYKLFPLAQDHKPLLDGNKGPNTGGMGSYAPTNWVPKELVDEIEQRIVIPTLEGLKKEDIEFVGLLFPGLVLTKNGPMVLEYNTRFGAPETQSFMMLLESDLDDLFEGVLTKELRNVALIWKKGFALTVELACPDYPKVVVSKERHEINVTDVPFAGRYFLGDLVQDDEGALYTIGGKAISVSAYAGTMEKVTVEAYKGVAGVSFDGMKYRHDIGQLDNTIPPRKN